MQLRLRFTFGLLFCAAILAAHIAGDNKFYAGFVEVNKDYGAHLYYYFVPSQSKPLSDPVILWLQGGPGCSSLFGAFVENGPQFIQENGTIIDNPYSWNTNASVIYIDSPVGTGYSYVESSEGYVTNEKTIGLELYDALYSFFFELHPEYRNLDFYIFGESYAGKYVPWLAYTILQENEKATNKISLKGIGVGDGWVNPYYQTGSYAPFLYQNNLINELELETANGIYDTYKGLIDVGAYILAESTGNALLELVVVEAGNVDVYDIRTTSDPTDPLQDALSIYLNLPDIQTKMNASAHEWTACSSTPYFFLVDDLSRSSEFLFPEILQKIPVLLYNGNYDLICNILGTTTWATTLDWPYQQDFNNAKAHNWTVAGETVGNYKSAATLTHLMVLNAGHMAPFNQPRNCLNMITTFITGGFKP